MDHLGEWIENLSTKINLVAHFGHKGQKMGNIMRFLGVFLQRESSYEYIYCMRPRQVIKDPGLTYLHLLLHLLVLLLVLHFSTSFFTC